MRVLLHNEINTAILPEFKKMKTCPDADDFRSAKVRIPTLVSLNKLLVRYWNGNDFNAMRQHYVEHPVDKIKTYAEQED